MDLWVPPVMSGLFSVAVVALGAWLVNQLEKKRHNLEAARADKASQHEVVTRFLQADRKLSAKLLRDITDISFQRDPEKMSPADFLAIAHLRMMYFNDCLQELLTLDAGIDDLKVRQAYDSLYEECSKQFNDHRDLLSAYGITGGSEKWEPIPRAIGSPESRKSYREALAKLIEVSRQQYRFSPD